MGGGIPACFATPYAGIAISNILNKISDLNGMIDNNYYLNINGAVSNIKYAKLNEELLRNLINLIEDSKDEIYSDLINEFKENPSSSFSFIKSGIKSKSGEKAHIMN